MSKYRIKKVTSANSETSQHTTYYIQRRVCGFWFYVRNLDFSRTGFPNVETALGQMKFYENVGHPRKIAKRDWKIIKVEYIYDDK